jgi:ornithine cyclodeaminase
MLFLSRDDVIAAGGDDIAAAMEVVRETLARMRAGETEMPAEMSVTLGPNGGAPQARAYALPARVADVVGVKWTAHRPGQGAASFALVNDALSGEPVGMVESGRLTAVRTAAVSALVLAALGEERRVRRVALLGAGLQARTHLRMLAHIFPGLERVVVWNRTPARARNLVAAARGTAPWGLEHAAELAFALAGADSVIACTNAAAPFIGPEAMRPGRSVLQIGYHEVSFDAIDRADAVLVDLWGEFRLTSAKSLFQMHRAGRFGAERVAADLARLVLDGWRPAPHAMVFFSSFGLNVFDIALAANMLAQARRMGIGTTLAPAGA